MAIDSQTLIDFLLEKRGVKSLEEKNEFLNPDYENHTHDPFLLKDCEKSVDRIYKAVKNGERIAVFSDYDADGIPGAVIAKDFFEKIGYKNFEIYIPHRHDEGFGLNSNAIDEIVERGAKLLITIDCGVADAKEISYAQSKNLDVVITDHHLPQEDVKAFAVVDHKQKDCKYPDKNLCGSAVFFKIVQGFFKKYGKKFNIPVGTEKWFLDMVAIATLSDMVALTGENRALAYYGLVVMRKTPRAGLNALFKKLYIDKKNITEDDIGFSITPRINAASRMGTPDDAFNLLSAKDGDDVEILAEKLEHVNNERKGTVAALVKEVRKIINERSVDPSTPLRARKIIVLGNPNWRPSLLGLAANTFAGEFSCPVFLWGRDGDNMIKGSVRSGGGANVMEIMQNVRSGVLSDFGGHTMSGGFTVEKESVALLEKELEIAFANIVEVKKEVLPEQNFDLEIAIDDVSNDLYMAISKLAPFGMDNPKPIFLFRNVLIISVKKFGKEKNHMEVILKKTRGQVKAIQFFTDEDIFKKLEGEKSFSFTGAIEKSTFGGRTELRVRILELI